MKPLVIYHADCADGFAAGFEVPIVKLLGWIRG